MEEFTAGLARRAAAERAAAVRVGMPTAERGLQNACDWLDGIRFMVASVHNGNSEHERNPVYRLVGRAEASSHARLGREVRPPALPCNASGAERRQQLVQQCTVAACQPAMKHSVPPGVRTFSRRAHIG